MSGLTLSGKVHIPKPAIPLSLGNAMLVSYSSRFATSCRLATARATAGQGDFAAISYS